MSGELTNFDLMINISSGAEIPYFYAAQWVLEWNCSLFEIRNVWIAGNAVGRLWNGSEWIESDYTGCSLTGSNPQCPVSTQGKSNFLVEWTNHYQLIQNGEGVTVPAGVEGTMLNAVRFRTYSGGDFKTGTTDITFVPTLKTTGYLFGAYDYDQDNVTWTGTSVTVN